MNKVIFISSVLKRMWHDSFNRMMKSVFLLPAMMSDCNTSCLSEPRLVSVYFPHIMEKQMVKRGVPFQCRERFRCAAENDHADALMWVTLGEAA